MATTSGCFMQNKGNHQSPNRYKIVFICLQWNHFKRINLQLDLLLLNRKNASLLHKAQFFFPSPAGSLIGAADFLLPLSLSLCLPSGPQVSYEERHLMGCGSFKQHITLDHPDLDHTHQGMDHSQEITGSSSPPLMGSLWVKGTFIFSLNPKIQNEP